MKAYSIFFVFLILSISCANPSEENSSQIKNNNPQSPNATQAKPTPEITKDIKLTLSFSYGVELEPIRFKNIYAIWIADTAGNYIQHINICRNLFDEDMDTGVALPFWRQEALRETGKEEIDAVTSATHQSEDFLIETHYKAPQFKQFIIYFEMDRYQEANDWFEDQPAVLYAANVDLDDPVNLYTLEPIGWSTNHFNTMSNDNPPLGELQNEMRYITHHKNGVEFGTPDHRAATNMVKTIQLIIGD